MISITFNSSAFSEVIDALSFTDDLAHSTLRLRLVAIASMRPTAKFSPFCFITSSVFSTPPGPSETGCAAPMLVFGAIAATSAARVIKQPALVALAPGGAT